MNKILVEVFCPITNQNYDMYIPKTLVFSDIKMLIGKIIENISMNTYFRNYDIVLCDFESGKMIDDSKTPQDLGILNGYKMIIM